MSTAAQRPANQANSQFRHGFRSQTVLLPGDDTEEYAILLGSLTEHFSPANLTESRFIREMADAEWRLRRVRRHLESALSRHMATLATGNPEASETELQSLAVETLCQTGTSYGTWLRYETKFGRQYDRALKDWTRYQETRRNAESREANTALNKALLASPPQAPHKSASNVQNAPSARPPATDLASNVQIARNADCPCGSRQKYKRCCGRSAPPVLGNPLPKAA
jgi:hypothetical protein